MNLDNNFPAPLQALLFLGTATLCGMLVLVTVYGAIRKRRWTRWLLVGLGTIVLAYLGLILIFSGVSREVTLARGQEKYFCEIDCHLAYSIADVQERPAGDGIRQIAVTLRTRFDQTTISAHRPKDAPLTPNPRATELVDAAGKVFRPTAQQGTPLTQPLIPGQSYDSILIFQVPEASKGLRLLVTAPEGPVQWLIGNEMSFGHKKTYLTL